MLSEEVSVTLWPHSHHQHVKVVWNEASYTGVIQEAHAHVSVPRHLPAQHIVSLTHQRVASFPHVLGTRLIKVMYTVINIAQKNVVYVCTLSISSNLSTFGSPSVCKLNMQYRTVVMSRTCVLCMPRAWRLVGRGTGRMQSSCGVDSRSWGWKSLSKMRYADL